MGLIMTAIGPLVRPGSRLRSLQGAPFASQRRISRQAKSIHPCARSMHNGPVPLEANLDALAEQNLRVRTRKTSQKSSLSCASRWRRKLDARADTASAWPTAGPMV